MVFSHHWNHPNSPCLPDLKITFITGSSIGLVPAAAKLSYAHRWNVVTTMCNPVKREEPARVLVERLDIDE